MELKTATQLLWQLDNPTSLAREHITEERMNTKLEWMLEFRQKINQWRRIERVIDDALGFINRQGLYVPQSPGSRSG